MCFFIAGLLKEDILMMNFLPELKETSASYKEVGEYIIVIDRSGNARMLVV